MFWIYILYSEKSDLYYIGFSDDPGRRIVEHNENKRVTFTSKHQPWILKAKFLIGTSRSEAMMVEKFIKRKKRREFILLLIEKQNDKKFIDELIRLSSAG